MYFYFNRGHFIPLKFAGLRKILLPKYLNSNYLDKPALTSHSQIGVIKPTGVVDSSYYISVVKESSP